MDRLLTMLDIQEHLDSFKLDSVIDVTIKLHGMPFMCGNLLIDYPKPMYQVRRFVNNLFHTHIQERSQDYGKVCSANGGATKDEYASIIYPYLPKGVTVYGEICGYFNGEQMIHKGYDYGCGVGNNFLMIHRITEQVAKGVKEYSISEVITFTNYVIRAMQNVGDVNVDRIFNISNVTKYHGTVSGLVSNVDELPDILAKKCKIDENEPLCVNKVPREGLVVRMYGEDIMNAFKMKSAKFVGR